MKTVSHLLNYAIFGGFCAFAPSILVADTPVSRSTLFETPIIVDQKPNALTFGYSYSERKRDLFFEFQTSDRLRIALSFPKFTEGDTTVSGNDLNIAYTFLEETDMLPAFAVGVSGLGSEGRGAGEYIALAKGFGDFQATVGLGWGRYAGRNAARGEDSGPFTIDHLFQGDSEVFGSVIWNAPINGLAVGLEYGAERQFDGTSAFVTRAGASYATARGLSYSGYVSDEGDYGVQLALTLNPEVPFTLPDGQNAPALMNSTPIPNVSDQVMLTRLQERFEDSNLRLERLSTRGDVVSVTVNARGDRNFARVTGRTARILSIVAPSRYQRFAITQTAGPFDTNTIVLRRDMLADAVDRPDAARRVLDSAAFQSTPIQQDDPLYQSTFRPYRSFGLSPRFSFDIQSEDELELVGELTASASYFFTPNTRVAGQLGYRFLSQWEQTEAPETPEVRGDRNAYTPDEIFLKSATIAHRTKLSEDVYARVSAGLFEREYGGVSAEAIWRDPNLNFSLGFEATYAQKRAYEDWFGFQDLSATTYIGSLYTNLGSNGDFVVIDAGQYLAGDLGVSLTVGRDFSNGWRVAAFTKWSDELEDTMQYGVSLDIPLDWAIPGRGTDNINVRIGGGGTGNLVSRVGGTNTLAGTLRASDPQRLRDEWGAFWD